MVERWLRCHLLHVNQDLEYDNQRPNRKDGKWTLKTGATFIVLKNSIDKPYPILVV
jgi:hypothetical protein